LEFEKQNGINVPSDAARGNKKGGKMKKKYCKLEKQLQIESADNNLLV
jgi:hypothetical protein